MYEKQVLGVARRGSMISLESSVSQRIGDAEISRSHDRVELRHGDQTIVLALGDARILAAALLQLTR